MLLQMVRDRNLRVRDVVKLQRHYKKAHKKLGKGAPTGRRAPENVSNLQFWHFGPFFGPACSPDVGDWWQNVYGVLCV